MLKVRLLLILVCVSIAAVAQESNGCFAEALAKESALRKEAFTKMYVPGQKANNATIGTQQLYDIESKTTVLVFWKTDCPFCKNLITVIEETVQKESLNEVKIVAVCLDTEIVTWQKQLFVKMKHPSLINICDGKGYFGDVATRFNVYATPTMILLDQNHCFKKLPKNIEALNKILKNED
jgi:thioredoxin-related protein